MNSGKYHSSEQWLLHNLRNNNTAAGASLLASPTSFRLRALPLLLAIAALTVAVMWYQERELNVLTLADRIGYPVLLVVTTFGTILLRVRPASLRLVMALAFSTYVAHMMASYYLAMGHRIFEGASSNYEMTVLSLWLAFGYVGSFVFFSPRTALHTSLMLYAGIALPQLLLLTTEITPIERHIALATLVSQPLYIVALWGVGLLKKQASGVHHLAKSMNEAASLDPLTGIANRRALDYVMQQVVEAQPQSGRPIALLLIDVDHFKRINDTYGHAVGDDVLIRLSHEIAIRLRSSDFLGRWGGEEFMVISMDQTEQQALQMAERLRNELAHYLFPTVGLVTISIGVAAFHSGEPIDTFIARADKALYRAKAGGRNRVEAAATSESVSSSPAT